MLEITQKVRIIVIGFFPRRKQLLVVKFQDIYSPKYLQKKIPRKNRQDLI